MKKLFTLLLALLICPLAYAGTITIPTVSSDDTLTIGFFNNAFDEIKNTMNGGIDADNIENDSLVEADMADEINPRIRSQEQLGDYTYTGMLPATDASDLTSDISAGTSYVEGYRVVTTATEHTYTASKDTYVYIDINGTFQYEEVANDAAAPTTPSNSLLLAVVVTDADNITSVTDSRTTAPTAIRTYQKYRQGYVISYDSVSQLTVTPGEIDLGASGDLRINPSDTTVTWSNIDTGAEAGSTYYAVWAYPHATSATLASFAISTSFTDASGISNERLIGWFYNDSASNISGDSMGCYKGDGSGMNNSCKNGGTGTILIDDANYGTDFASSTNYFYCSGSRPVQIIAKVTVMWKTGTSEPAFIIDIDGVDQTDSEGGPGVVDDATALWTTTLLWQGVLGAGTHTVIIQGKENLGTSQYDVQEWVMTITEL